MTEDIQVTFNTRLSTAGNETSNNIFALNYSVRAKVFPLQNRRRIKKGKKRGTNFLFRTDI